MTSNFLGERTYARRMGEHLQSYYALFPDDRQRLSVLNQQIDSGEPNLCDRRTLPGHLTASALVIDRETQTALLIHHNALKRWLQPGGHMEPGEMPLEGARRELEEEVGAVAAVLHPWHEQSGVCLDVDSHIIPANEKKQEPQHLHHDFQYIYLLERKQDVSLQWEEVSAFRWVEIAQLQTGEFGTRLARVADKLQRISLIKS